MPKLKFRFNGQGGPFIPKTYSTTTTLTHNLRKAAIHYSFSSTYLHLVDFQKKQQPNLLLIASSNSLAYIIN
jgi:hypothetical protein